MKFGKMEVCLKSPQPPCIQTHLNHWWELIICCKNSLIGGIVNLPWSKIKYNKCALKGWCTGHNTSHFLCAKFSPARAVLYLQLNRALLWCNRTTQRFNTAAGVQKPACGAIVSDDLRCHSFWRPWVAWFLNTCGGVKSLCGSGGSQ